MVDGNGKAKQQAKRFMEQHADKVLGQQPEAPRRILVGMGMYRYPDPETIAQTMKMLWDWNSRFGHEIEANWAPCPHTELYRMRTRYAEAILDTPEVSHIMMIDDDMMWPVNDGIDSATGELSQFNPIQRMLSLDKDMVGALCFARDQKCHPYVGIENDDGMCEFAFEPKTLMSGTPFQVDFIGFGMVLIKREVFEGILEQCHGSVEAIFRRSNNWTASKEKLEALASLMASQHDWTCAGEDALRSAAAQIEELAADCMELSEDYSFCRRVRRAGFEVWCDPSFDCLHFGKHGYGRQHWWHTTGKILQERFEGANQELTRVGDSP